MKGTHKPNRTSKTHVYGNLIIERLTRTHISLPLSIFSVISIYLIYIGVVDKGINGLLLLAVSGFLMGIDAIATLANGWRRYANGEPLLADDDSPGHAGI